MDDLLAATTNHGKLVEIRSIFTHYFHRPIRVISPAELGTVLDVTEDRATYAENAAKKALAYSTTCFMITLADDSGLEVDVLGGKPGLHSARFTGRKGATDADRRAFLLDALKPFPRPWAARFRCFVAVALSDGSVYTYEGECRGEIVPKERGTRGFGYDPVFQMDDPVYGGRTMAELSLEEKNQVSHRSRALRAAFPVIEELLKKEK